MKFFSPTAQGFALVIISTMLMICLVFGLEQTSLAPLNPIIGLLGMAALIILILCILSKLALPLYILVAGPSIALSVSGSGILSRLYIGDLLFVVIVGIWLLYKMSSKGKGRLAKREMRILVPLIFLIFIGFLSIVSSHLSPDPHVTYAFVHSDVPLLVVNA